MTARNERSAAVPTGKGPGSMKPGAVSVRNVSRRFKVVQERNLTLKETLLRRGRVKAIDKLAVTGVSFDVEPGDALGIVGRNGSGKSTLLKLIAGTLPPHHGSIEVGGRLTSLLELGAGFHPDFSGRENVYINGSIHGLSEREVDARLDEIIAFSELRDYIEMPVRTYSSGMYMRLAFAISSHLDPDVLLLDEVLAVGDEAFQRKCLGRMFDYRRSGGTLLFVSHDPNAVEQICDRAVMLEEGKIVEQGDPKDVLTTYHRLLARRGGRLQEPPSPAPRSAPQVATPSHHATPKPEEAPTTPVWGTGNAMITAFHTIGPDGATDRFVSGDPMTVEMEVTPQVPIELPVFGITIHAATGELCYGTHTGIDTVPLAAIREPVIVRYEIPHLRLQEGLFLITLAVSEGGEVCHWLDRCISFSVYPSSHGVGIVDLAGGWSVNGPVGSPPASPTPNSVSADEDRLGSLASSS